ncbi:MAG: ribosome silencing factor [Armatimonadetes bacterium]|nr:ribosome silencing factor [Armatimonadota bacterium]
MSSRRAKTDSREKALTSEEKALLAREAVIDKRGLDPVLLDMREITVITDFFLICSGRSNVHIRALSEAVLDALDAAGFRPRGVEGKGEGNWVLLDFGDLIVHVFSEENREFYSLERLWSDAVRVPETVTSQA